MKSRVFSLDLINKPDYHRLLVYRTNGTGRGGGVRFYRLTVSRLIRLLRAMCTVSTGSECKTWMTGDSASWCILGVVEEMQAAQAALAAAS